MTENFKDLFEASLKETEMRVGKIIKATIVAIDREFAWIDAGLKSESIVSLDQFKNDQGEIEVQIGDQVDVVLDALDNSNGETRLSREKAKRIEVWDALEKACDDQETVLGRITNHVRGGYTVEVKGLRAFLPGSLVDVRPLRDISHLEDKDIELKIVKLDTKRNNIVVSRRAVIEAETQEDREALFEKLSEGSVVKGVVKNITDFGAFIDLGGVDGLLHITDMSWSRIKHPSDMLALGDEIDIKIIKFDNDKGRISLGIKQLGEDPWASVAEELAVGTKLMGKITNITDYGCFVKLKEGIEGLVHTSEMDWTNKNANPHKLVSLGQEVEVMVLEVDASRHRISLGMKQCIINPWQAFADAHKPGDKVNGKIRSITDFGIFIGLDGNIDGLVHISDVAWNKAEDVVKQLKKGEDIEAVMLSVDIERERIALGIKQLSDDPFTQYTSANDKGAKVTGVITAVQQNGANVELAPEVEGFIRVADISREHVEDARHVLKVGQEIEARVSNIDTKRRSINLSIKGLDEDMEKTAKTNYKAEQMAPTTIGDLIKEKLNK
ncbi:MULTISPECIES: 30S ribosomal protein S1 [Cysteiniphilum]|uniref:Small ribosomal subunit protein bS1 n=1 Tax=Cysteiniphilum litorale TaxID=2056700 RepID=A0A8J3E7Q0_9GAMM|nr:MULTISPECIES: 30S ribosomal protein S1 [Cysteiniphilum]GGF88061.1 30S ribosomal protein S1 [Cysteiniphilum litorale]